MNIDAMVISVDEPQLERCVEAVNSQTVPFHKIICVNGVVPESVAFAEALRQTESDWIIHVAGDVILYDDAVELMSESVTQHQERRSKVCGHYFGLYDQFLDTTIGYIGIIYGPVYKVIRYPNQISNDRQVIRKLRRRGWYLSKDVDMVVGTHMADPDRFQVFRRFFAQGMKYDSEFVIVQLEILFNETSDQLYMTALNAIRFAKAKRNYRSSRNITFDKEMYNEFNLRYPDGDYDRYYPAILHS
jgi:hypothetical protein